MAPSFESIAQWRVTPENPPRAIDGLDSERCAALHNFIVLYAWTSYHGLPVEKFSPSSRWEIYANAAESFLPKLHPSVVDFLQRAYEVPRELSFFTYLHALNIPDDQFWFCGHLGEPDRTITLYTTHAELGSNPDGLVCDQADHSVRMNFSFEDFGFHEDDQLQEGWLKLETVLSIYIDMIERGKVVALSQQTIQELNEAPSVDPITGACNLGEIFGRPWAMLPYSPSELEETVTRWNELVAEIPKRMPSHVEDEQGTPQQALVDAAHLDAAGVPPGFAREFLSRAQRPNFAFIAPGIRVSTAEEFVAQPFRKVVGPDFGPDFRWPIRLFMMEHANQYSAAKTEYPVSLQLSRMPCGLYLDFCSVQKACPFEDDTLVVFPFDKFACYQDGSSPGVWKTEKTHVYGKEHGTQLLAILENMYLRVGQGDWQVNEHGVAGGISWFEEASVAELEQWYSIPVGPGRFC